MDAANKTEKIAAPSGKHDDYCDSSVMALLATLSMLPAGAGVASSNRGGGGSDRIQRAPTKRQYWSGKSVLTTAARSHRLNKGIRF